MHRRATQVAARITTGGRLSRKMDSNCEHFGSRKKTKTETMHVGPPNGLSESESSLSSPNSRLVSKSTSRERWNVAWRCRTSREGTRKRTSGCVQRMQRFNKGMRSLKWRGWLPLPPFTSHGSALSAPMMRPLYSRQREPRPQRSLTLSPPPVLILPPLPRPLL